MKVFGPLYPLPLQLAVNHAERFCALLDSYEQSPPSSDENFVAWFTGRAGEVVRVVENAVADWNDGQTADAAGMRVEQYLRGLHEDLLMHDVVNDWTGLPVCCIAPHSTTVRATPYEAATPSVPQIPVAAESSPRRSGTVAVSVDDALIEHMLSECEPKAN